MRIPRLRHWTDGGRGLHAGHARLHLYRRPWQTSLAPQLVAVTGRFSAPLATPAAARDRHETSSSRPSRWAPSPCRTASSSPRCASTPPMDGCMNDWHLQHLMTLAMSGAGLVVIEATAVERLGRITHGCVGLYNDANERALKRVLDAARAVALPGTKIRHPDRPCRPQGLLGAPWEGGGPFEGHCGPRGRPSPLPRSPSTRAGTPRAR